MILASIILIAALAVLAPTLVRTLGQRAAYAFALVPAGLTVYYASLLPAVTDGIPALQRLQWVAAIDTHLQFRVDGLSLMFALLVCGVGTLVLLYAAAYMRGHPQMGRFFAYLIGFMGSMLGLVVADNLLLLFIFWELTSITSYLLIGFEHEREKARKSALQALLVTGLGGMAMLAGLILLGVAAGSFELSTIIAMGPAAIAQAPFADAAVVLLLLGAFTKSAQFPFHFWLPNAMEAPSPVSAYLHSSTMVKAGVYLAARLSPVLADHWLWESALIWFGAATMLLGAYLGSRQTALKPMLAYTTVSSLGAIMMLLGLDQPAAACAYLLGHAMFKGALFLVAGIVTHETHVKDAEKLGGLARAMPITAAAAGLAAASMAGVPPLAGFVGKEFLLKGALDAQGTPAIILTIAAALTGVLTVLIAALVALRPFFSRPALPLPDDAHPHDPSPAMWIGPALLALLGLITALVPGLFTGPLTLAAASSVRGAPVLADLSLAYTLKPGLALALSLGALVLGALLYLIRSPWRRATEPLAALDAVGPERLYQHTLRGLTFTAWAQTRLLQSGSLPAYIKIITAAMLALTTIMLLRDRDLLVLAADDEAPQAVEILLVILIGAASVIITGFRSRLATVAGLGVVGYSVAVLFVLFGAPDVAMTQFAIETLTVIIFVLAIYHLPRFARYSSTPLRLADAALSACFGLLMGALVLVARAHPAGEPISGFFAENALPGGKGRNVVNVIIVDFRALDTLGEIVVLGLAAVGVFTLLRLREVGREGP